MWLWIKKKRTLSILWGFVCLMTDELDCYECPSCDGTGDNYVGDVIDGYCTHCGGSGVLDD